MNKRDVGEIKKSLNLKNCSIDKIWESFYNSDHENVFSNSFDFTHLNDDEKIAYVDIFKKILSSNIYKNAFNIKVSNELFSSSDFKLYESYKDLDNNKIFDLINDFSKFYSSENGFVFLVCSGKYDIPIKDDENKVLESENIYNFMIFAICPIKSNKPNLIQNISCKKLVVSNNSLALSNPDLGFLYPSFNNRVPDVNESLFYIKNTKELYEDLLEHIFGDNCFNNSVYSKENYDSFIEDNVPNLNFENYSQLNEKIRDCGVQMEENGLEPLLTNSDFKKILPNSENLEYDVIFNAFSISSEKYVLSYPDNNDLKLTVSKEGLDMIKEKNIDGVSYILIPTSGLQVNGVNIKNLKEKKGDKDD